VVGGVFECVDGVPFGGGEVGDQETLGVVTRGGDEAGVDEVGQCYGSPAVGGGWGVVGDSVDKGG
jgi:hypothetical protein